MAVTNHGNLVHVQKVCEILRGSGALSAYQNYCEWPAGAAWWERGAIYSLGRTLPDTVGDAIEVLRDRKSFQAYSIAYLISLGTTFYLFSSTLKIVRKSSQYHLFVLANCAFLLSAVSGKDIGRWIIITCFHNFGALLSTWGTAIPIEKIRRPTFTLTIPVILISCLLWINHASPYAQFTDLLRSPLGNVWAEGLTYFLKVVEWTHFK
jgi:hypothetical protein